MKRTDTCKTCSFFNPQIDPNNLGAGRGICMYAPPTPIPIQNPQNPANIQIIPMRPGTHESEWCHHRKPLPPRLTADK